MTPRRTWSQSEDSKLTSLVARFGDKRGRESKWHEISKHLPGRTNKDCRKRWFHSLDPSLRKGRWTVEEDRLLLDAYQRLGPAWKEIAALIAGRKDDQCSKRYNDILNPSVRNRLEDWSPQEDLYLTAKVAELGNKWAAIAPGLPGRPPLTCRNRWRKLMRASQKERIQTRSSGSGGGGDSTTSNNETELASVALSTPVADTPMTSTSTSTSTTTSTSISVSSSRRESRRLGTPSLAFEGGIASPLALAGGDTIPSTLFDTQDATAVPGSGTGQLPTVPTGNSYSLSQHEAEETFTPLDGDAADAFIQSLGFLNDQGEGGWDMNIDPALGLEADIGQPQQTIQGNRDPVQAPSSAEIATDSVEEAVREALASFTQQHPGHRAGMQQQQQQQHYMHHIHVHHHHYHHHYHHHKYQS